MIRVILHGALAEAVGRSRWRLHVKSVGEALRAIEANTHKLFTYLAKYKEGKAPYEVYIDKTPVSREDELCIPVVSDSTIHIVPAVGGADDAGSIFLAIGLVLLVVAISVFSYGTMAGYAAVGLTATQYLGTTTMFFVGLAFTMGLSMTIAGVTSLLTKNPSYDSGEKNHPSYLFNGVVNTTYQGNCVPVGYGECLVGSQVISMGISTSEIPINA